MKIKKEFVHEDGEERVWYLDTEEKLLFYKGRAKYFQPKSSKEGS